VLLKVVMIAGVVLVALPSLWLGIRGAGRRSGYNAADPGDRASVIVLVVLRGLTLLLVFDLPPAALVLLTFGRRDQRPARRRGSPARR
jgi:hypothetical protein